MFGIYWKRFITNRMAVAGIAVLLCLVALAILAPVISRYEPTVTNLTVRLKSPCFAHPLGTDELGRDILSRMLYGSRISLSVGLIAVLISIVIGTLFGLLAGWYGGWVDSVIMRLVDIVLCFPSFFLILMVIAFVGPNITNIMIVIGATSWPGLARLVRGEILSIREREFISATRLLGLSNWRIMLVHILPNVMSPILISATLGVGAAILTESGLSFLGLGVQPPTASWGNMITSGKDYITFAWWLTAFPGLAILTAVLAFNMLGEGLREVFDPRSLKQK